MSTAEPTFSGFTPQATELLRALHANNSKAWYEEHKPEFQQVVVKPFLDLATDLAELMVVIDPLIEVNPKRVISRIYRDTRFSKDKSLYKRAMWITYKRSRDSWTDCPAFYFEITPEYYRYGMGFYLASSQTMAKFRTRIDEKPQDFLAATSFYKQQSLFALEGERYKRPVGIDKPDAIREWYQMKNFYLACNRPIETRLFQPELVDDLRYGFSLLAPLYHYLWELK